jgi:hypothetical protein
MFDHGNEGGDADAACDEQVLLGVNEFEVVPRSDDIHTVADSESRVQVFRSAAAVRFPQYPEAIAGPVTGAAAQGVLAYEVGTCEDVDVGAWLPDGQRRSARIAEDHANDPFGFVASL